MYTRLNRGTSGSSDDNCNSLYYGKQPGANGTGFPLLYDIDEETVNSMRVVHQEYSRLPFELYKSCVELLPICCVDVICKRRSDDKILLFYRRDKPAASIWWWPGGRLFRGETFFDCAIRKIRDETGNPNAKVYPLGVVDVFNTFFPDSNWDDKRQPGREGTQTVNICVAVEVDEPHLEVEASAQSTWAVERHRWVSAEEVLQGTFDKYVWLNVKKCRQLGYL